MTAANQPVLIAGTWRPARTVGTYRACEPATGAPRDAVWPVSGWDDLDEALDAATAAAAELARLPGALRDALPPGRPWRFIDSGWTRGGAEE